MLLLNYVVMLFWCYGVLNFFVLKKCIFTASDVDRNSNSDGSLHPFLSFFLLKIVDFQMLQHFFWKVYFKFPSLESWTIKRYKFWNQINAINVKLFYVAIDQNVIAGQRRFEYLFFWFWLNHKFVTSMLECNRWFELPGYHKKF